MPFTTFKVAIELDNENGKFTQLQAGNLPIKSSEIKCFRIDGTTNEEVLYKIIVNTIAVFTSSVSKENSSDWTNKINKYKRIFLDVVEKDRLEAD